jgi:hypothetical protein
VLQKYKHTNSHGLEKQKNTAKNTSQAKTLVSVSIKLNHIMIHIDFKWEGESR